mmetsp:Transcript_45033/g.133301  ORF Transcript_45033/g.133301 Transcript_45033/m.133301 type:complete len:222 (-) Transcript_45033:77-742(-)
MSSASGAALKVLDMRTNQVGAEGACAMLGALEHHTHMKEMRVGYNRGHNREGELDLATANQACKLLQKALARGAGSTLRTLDLNNVRIGDQGMARIALSLGEDSLLRQLFLAFNAIGPDGMQAIANALLANYALEELDLRDNEAGDEGAVALAGALRKNFALKKLHVARNEIGDAGAKAFHELQKVSPKIVVDWGASGSTMNHMRGMGRLQCMTSNKVLFV